MRISLWEKGVGEERKSSTPLSIDIQRKCFDILLKHKRLIECGRSVSVRAFVSTSVMVNSCGRWFGKEKMRIYRYVGKADIASLTLFFPIS